MVDDALNIRKELEKSLEAGTVRFGKNNVMRALKQGLASKIFYAKNTPAKLISDLEYYSKLSDVQLVMYPGDSKELGVALKRTHKVLLSVILKA